MGINECPSIVIMCEDADEATKKYIETAKKTGEGPEYIFLIAKGGGPIEQLKALTTKDAGDAMKARAEGKRPAMLLFDIPDEGAFYLAEAHDQITTDAIASFIESKEAGN